MVAGATAEHSQSHLTQADRHAAAPGARQAGARCAALSTADPRNTSPQHPPPAHAVVVPAALPYLASVMAKQAPANVVVNTPPEVLSAAANFEVGSACQTSCCMHAFVG